MSVRWNFLHQQWISFDPENKDEKNLQVNVSWFSQVLSLHPPIISLPLFIGVQVVRGPIPAVKLYSLLWWKPWVTVILCSHLLSCNEDKTPLLVQQLTQNISVVTTNVLKHTLVVTWQLHKTALQELKMGDAYEVMLVTKILSVQYCRRNVSEMCRKKCVHLLKCF